MWRYRTLVEKDGATFGSLDDYISNNRKESQKPLRDGFVSWCINYSETVGDDMPNETAVVLPYAKIEGVFEEYVYRQDCINQKLFFVIIRMLVRFL